MVDTEQLGRAVIKQALADAGVGMASGERLGVNEADRNAARSFLTANSGGWKAAREFWTSLADLDPEKLRTGTMKLLGIEAPPPEPVRERLADEPLRLFYPVPKPSKPTKPKRTPRPTPPVFVQSGGMSKRQQVLAMLMRHEGVSLDEIIAKFGWARATAQTSIGYDLKTYGVRGKRGPDGRYRAVALN